VVTVEGTGIEKMADLKGKRVSTGSPGSATEVMAFRVIEGAGLDKDADMKRERLGVAESTNALKDRKIDAYFWVGGLPTAAVTDLGAGVTPNAINNAGQVVGQDALGQAFMWQTGMMTTLPTLGGNGGKANDINDNGVIVGWTYDSTGMQRAFKWNGTITNLDIGGTGASEAVSVNSYGAIVGWRYTSPNYRAMLWNGLGGQAILSYNSKATGINDSGHVVAVSVDSSTGNPSGGAYYWDGTFGSRNTFTNARIGYNVLKINNNNLSLGYSPSMYVVGGGMSKGSAGAGGGVGSYPISPAAFLTASDTAMLSSNADIASAMTLSVSAISAAARSKASR
jgi:probable HAF family extracellular repeat protein